MSSSSKFLRKHAVGLFLADLHHDHVVPSARGETQDEWYESQKRQVRAVERRWAELGCPLVVVCGDWFHSGWKPHRCPPELINRVIDWWKCFKDSEGQSCVWSVPGNHDLPYHRYQDKEKSAYWTLVQSGVVNDLGEHAEIAGTVVLHGFPWGGRTPHKLSQQYLDNFHARHGQEYVHVAVVHDYIWSHGHSFPNAPQDKYARRHAENLAGFDLAFFGDNHSSFDVLYGDRGNTNFPYLVNCGRFMNRNADERDKPCYFWVLWSDKTVTKELFDTSRDKWHDRSVHDHKDDASPPDFSAFLDLLAKDPKKALDFADVFARALDRPEVAEAVRLVGLACLEEAQK